MAQRRVRQVQCDLFFAMPPVGCDDLQALAAGATATVSILLMSAFLRGGGNNGRCTLLIGYLHI